VVTEMTGPRFSLKSELARHISIDKRLKGNRPAVAAFIDPPSEDPSKEYLSVNSLEVEAVEEIADYYRERFQKGAGDVAVSTIKVFEFNEAGRKSGLDLSYDSGTSMWNFLEKGAKKAAYMHRPTGGGRDSLKSQSHCGVEFVRLLDEYAQSKFARRLSGKKYHLFRMRRSPRPGRNGR
jgi:hypothetical protein